MLTLRLAGFIISFFLLVVFRLVIALSVPLLFIGALYGSMWLVQIYRTIRRGRASGLAAEYLVGVTVCRLYYLLCECISFVHTHFDSHSADFLGCPSNVLDIETRRKFCTIWL